MDRQTYLLVQSEAALQRYQRSRKREPWHDSKGVPMWMSRVHKTMARCRTLLHKWRPVLKGRMASSPGDRTTESFG